MYGPGEVLLVSCYELGHQPLGTALPAAFLERAGFAPAQLDLAVQPFDEAAVRRARFIAVSAPMHTALRIGARLVERTRRANPDVFLCFHGLYAALNAPYLLGHGVDATLAGECEPELVRLALAVAQGRRPRGAVPPVIERLDFPVPLRSGSPAEPGYARLVHEERLVPAGYVEASRGCLHHCLHCPIPPIYHGRFFVVPAAVVLEDVRRMVAQGVAHITFGDPDFLNGPGHSLRIVRALHREFPQLTFDCTTKVEHILRHRAVFPELGRLGCLFVVSAVESLSDRVLASLEKGHSRADVFEALRITRAAGVALRPSFVAFTPWTTLEDYIDVLAFVEAEGLIAQIDPVQLTIRLLVPPGSTLLDTPRMREHLGALDAAGFSYFWTHPDPRMDRLHRHVVRLVERATRRGEAAAVTFERIKVLACTLQDGRRPRRREPLEAALPGQSPRLTEPWFC
ncbi:MAG: CUAEP/CCAEP-tail radical SAM (seleno)protein [Gemmatimonadales bacterium]